MPPNASFFLPQCVTLFFNHYLVTHSLNLSLSLHHTTTLSTWTFLYIIYCDWSFCECLITFLNRYEWEVRWMWKSVWSTNVGGIDRILILCFPTVGLAFPPPHIGIGLLHIGWFLNFRYMWYSQHSYNAIHFRLKWKKDSMWENAWTTSVGGIVQMLILYSPCSTSPHI